MEKKKRKSAVQCRSITVLYNHNTSFSLGQKWVLIKGQRYLLNKVAFVVKNDLFFLTRLSSDFKPDPKFYFRSKSLDDPFRFLTKFSHVTQLLWEERERECVW